MGWPFKSGTRFRQAPSSSALDNLLRQLNPHALAAVLNGWRAAHLGTLPRALALDGKRVRDLVLTLCRSDHQTGAPVAVTVAQSAPASAEAQAEGERTAARRLYRQTELNGALVTADALHCEPQTLRLIVEGGGDDLLALKANPSTALKRAQALAAQESLLLPASRSKPSTAGWTTGRYRSLPWDRPRWTCPLCAAWSKNWRLNAVWAVWRAGLMGLGAAGATGAAFELADAL